MHNPNFDPYYPVYREKELHDWIVNTFGLNYDQGSPSWIIIRDWFFHKPNGGNMENVVLNCGGHAANLLAAVISTVHSFQNGGSSSIYSELPAEIVDIENIIDVAFNQFYNKNVINLLTSDLTFPNTPKTTSIRLTSIVSDVVSSEVTIVADLTPVKLSTLDLVSLQASTVSFNQNLVTAGTIFWKCDLSEYIKIPNVSPRYTSVAIDIKDILPTSTPASSAPIALPPPPTSGILGNNPWFGPYINAPAPGAFDLSAQDLFGPDLKNCMKCKRELSSYLDAWHGDPLSNQADLCSNCRIRYPTY